MALFTHPEYDAHELVLFHSDPASGLRAIIAVHSTAFGPSLGGCRMFPYASDGDAVNDVLRLSRAMSHKAAMAEVPQGGGKSVIIGDPRRGKSEALMEAMGAFVDRAGGAYIVTEDSGISVDDVRLMSRRTRHFVGAAAPGARHDGNPSPATARGTLWAMQAMAERVLGTSDLHGVGVAIQGVGQVGGRLAHHLAEAGARLWVCDTFDDSARDIAAATGAQHVAPDAIYDVPAEIFSPCALGATLNADSIPRLQARIVCGAANNQLATAEDDARLADAGILYGPDFVVNAGGIIDLHYHARAEYDEAAATRHLARIPATLKAVLDAAGQRGGTPGLVAEALAAERIAAARKAAAHG